MKNFKGTIIIKPRNADEQTIKEKGEIYNEHYLCT